MFLQLSLETSKSDTLHATEHSSHGVLGAYVGQYVLCANRVQGKALDCSAEVRNPNSCSTVCKIACQQHYVRIQVRCTNSITCISTVTTGRQWAGGGSPHLTQAEQPAALPAMAGSCQACSSHRGGAPSPLLRLDPAGGLEWAPIYARSGYAGGHL